MSKRLFGSIALLLCSLLILTPESQGYSFLTHETIVDLAWQPAIVPALLSQYPNTTPSELRVAHAYAYGGSAIQDAGYYPFGHEFFSDLTHYVRTGDFISNLVHDARNVNELAFALGALSHYVGDTTGHQDAVNPSTAIEFPALEQKYGPVVTYYESPHGHVRTEFAFDIDQLSHARFAPSGYLRSVGMRVPIPLMEKAFYQTYGLRLSAILGNEYAAFNSYRWAVRSFLPRFAYAELVLHKSGFPQDEHSPAFIEFRDRLKTADKENNWELFRKHKLSFLTRVIAVAIVIVPKVGAMSDLSIRGPQQDTEEKYVESVNITVDRYSTLLHEVARNGAQKFELPDLDLDTGYKTRPGSYPLTDTTYAKLLHKITRDDVELHVPETLKQNVIAFYSQPLAPILTKRNNRKWKNIQVELALLKQKP